MKVCSLFACILIAAFASTTASAEAKPKHSWEVTILSTGLRNNARLTELSPAEMLVKTRDGSNVTIPFAGVEAILYKTAPKESSEFTDFYFGGQIGEPNSIMGMSIGFFGPMTGTTPGAAGLVGTAILGSVLGALVDGSGTNRTFEILWKDGNTDEMISLTTTDKKTAQAISSWLELRSGKKVIDVGAAAAQLKQRIQNERSHATPLAIDREVRMQGLRLKPQTYLALPLDESNGRTMLYLFKREVSPNKLAGVLLLTSEPLVESGPMSPVVYSERDRGAIVAIHLPGRQLVVRH